MNDRTLTIAGLVGAVSVVGLVLLGIYGFVTGSVLEPPEDLLASTVGILAVVVAVVGALIALGVRSRRWVQNPYW